MSEEVLARASEPPFTTKEEGRGTGLGLPMVHDFVTQAGGALRLKSVEGSGASVELLLPRSESAGPA